MSTENEIERANNKLLSIESLLLKASNKELELIRKLADSKGTTANVKHNWSMELFYADMERLISNLVRWREIYNQTQITKEDNNK